jgi:NADPH-dependent 2,4-dienoyl-CoA reductase/sulfur reductase-like enzyme
MAPGKNNEGFYDASMQNGTSDAYSVIKDDLDHVIVIGAGPAGLMLAQVRPQF